MERERTPKCYYSSPAPPAAVLPHASSMADPRVSSFCLAEEYQLYKASKKGRLFVLQYITRLVLRAGLLPDRETVLIEMMGDMQSSAGACTRIVSNPPPVALGLHSTGCLQAWMILIPFGLKTNTALIYVIYELLCMAILVLLMLGCDEVSTQLGRSWDGLCVSNAMRVRMPPTHHYAISPPTPPIATFHDNRGHVLMYVHTVKGSDEAHSNPKP